LTDATSLGRGKFTVNPDGRDLSAGFPATRLPVTQSIPRVLTWRRVLGAFQINLRIRTKENLLVPEEHRLALFRWIAENVLPENRWYPVMQRYIAQLAVRVTGFGGNPADVPPSPTGNVPTQPSPVETHRHEHHEVTGKVSGLVFDHFGDFEGFILETPGGDLERFQSREKHVMDILRDALEERIWVTVVRERHDQVRTIILRIPPPPHI
jgi:hypothetical protein